jgi:hypothetical protein
MMGKCTSCGKNIGMFGSTKSCDAEDCNVEGLCKECSSAKLSDCEKCGYTFCVAHIKNHECEEESDKEESEDSEDGEEEEEPVELSEDDVHVSKDKKFKMLLLEDYYNEDIVNFLEETEKEGYVLIGTDMGNSMYLFKELFQKSSIKMEVIKK